jgi:hypothetical protein
MPWFFNDLPDIYVAILVSGLLWNLLGQTRFDRARRFRSGTQLDARNDLLRLAVGDFDRVLTLDPENATAHHSLALIHDLLKPSTILSATIPRLGGT